MRDSEIIYRLYETLAENILPIALTVLFLFSVFLMFYWEGKVTAWLRLPVINLIAFFALFVLGVFEETYLTFHPGERTKYIKTSIFQRFF